MHYSNIYTLHDVYGEKRTHCNEWTKTSGGQSSTAYRQVMRKVYNRKDRYATRKALQNIAL